MTAGERDAWRQAAAIAERIAKSPAESRLAKRLAGLVLFLASKQEG